MDKKTTKKFNESRKTSKKSNNKNKYNKKNKNNKNNKKIIFSIITIIILAIIVSGTFYFLKATPKIAEESDKVSVLYYGYFDNNTPFDTNIYAKAVGTNLDFQGKTYEPLKFRIGSQQVIPGFEKAVIGMKEGDKKTIHLEPKDAYGEHKDSLVTTIDLEDQAPREIVLSRNLEIPKQVLLSQDPGVTIGFKFSQKGINYEVIGEKGDNFEVRMNPKTGDSIIMPNFKWPAIIKEIRDKEIVVFQTPVLGKSYQTNLAPVKVTELSNDTITIRLMLEKDAYLKTAKGTGKVINVTDKQATIDFNHPLAGKALNFDITLVSIEKAESNLKK